METQKIVNLLNGSGTKNWKFATKKWYVIEHESEGNYSGDDPITFLTKSIESSLCDYFDTYILVTGNITVTGGNANTKLAFKNCAPFKNCRTEINNTFVDYADFINVAIWLNTVIIIILQEFYGSLKETNSLWIIMKSLLILLQKILHHLNTNLIGNTVVDGANSIKERIKIAVPLKYLSNLWRSLEMSLIDYKVEISLKWYANCILPSAGTAATFTITDANVYVPVVALKIEDNTKL